MQDVYTSNHTRSHRTVPVCKACQLMTSHALFCLITFEHSSWKKQKQDLRCDEMICLQQPCVTTAAMKLMAAQALRGAACSWALTAQYSMINWKEWGGRPIRYSCSHKMDVAPRNETTAVCVFFYVRLRAWVWKQLLWRRREHCRLSGMWEGIKRSTKEGCEKMLAEVLRGVKWQSGWTYWS